MKSRALKPPQHLTPLEAARAIRLQSLPRAAEVLRELLESPNQAVRLAAAQAISDRVEGRPVQQFKQVEEDETEKHQRAEVRALFAWTMERSPELLGAVAAWGQAVSEGTPARPPAALPPPPPNHPARALWDRLVSAAPALPEGEPCQP
jgi:HEAT repeat protein